MLILCQCNVPFRNSNQAARNRSTQRRPRGGMHGDANRLADWKTDPKWICRFFLKSADFFEICRFLRRIFNCKFPNKKFGKKSADYVLSASESADLFWIRRFFLKSADLRVADFSDGGQQIVRWRGSCGEIRGNIDASSENKTCLDLGPSASCVALEKISGKFGRAGFGPDGVVLHKCF